MATTIRRRAPARAELTVHVDDADGALVVGVSGWTWGTRDGLGMVWMRADSWGGRLLAAAEQLARERGCERLFVSSCTFQAPAFYERHGYRQCARVEDHPVADAADVHLVQDLEEYGSAACQRRAWSSHRGTGRSSPPSRRSTCVVQGAGQRAAPHGCALSGCSLVLFSTSPARVLAYVTSRRYPSTATHTSGHVRDRRPVSRPSW